jgi:hypothetical protein
MKIKYVSISVVLIVLAYWSSSAISQDFNLYDMVSPPNPNASEAKLQVESNLDEAIEPLLDLFGFYTGGGLYHSAKVHGIGGFDVGIRVITMMISEDQKPDLPFPGNEAAYGGIFKDMELMALPLLQVSVGLPGSLEATGRFFTYPIGEGEDEGNITLIGLGVKYGLLQNMLLPRVAVVATYHYLNVPEEFDFGSANSLSAVLVVSKGFPIVDIYGGLGYDYTTLKVDLQFPDPIGPITKEYNKGNFRGNLGIKVKPIPLLFIHADYNFGGVQGFNMGLGLNFR